MKMHFYVAAKLLSATYGLLFSGYVAFVLTVLAIQHYLALRLKFDAELIEVIAQQSDTVAIEDLTQQFDQSLLQFKLIPKSKVGRDWSLRFAGCFRLFKLQITILFIQYIVLMILIYKLLAQ